MSIDAVTYWAVFMCGAMAAFVAVLIVIAIFDN